jgi:hypothetical protein
MSSVETLIDRQTTDAGEDGVMKALVYHGRGQRAWEPKPKPTIRERATPSFESRPRRFAAPTSIS